jgi:ethanolamine utilization protein EutJ
MTDPVAHLHGIVNHPQSWNFAGARKLYTGVDLGTYKTIAIVIDERGHPRAAAMRTANVVRSGLIVDYVGALHIVRELMEELRSRCPVPLEQGATSYPPQTEYANLKTTTYILEGVGLEVLAVLDEPTAANQVLMIKNGAIVDVGGGTTGIAVIQNGRVVYSNDEATRGVHHTLVLAGNFRISYEEAEQIKIDRRRSREVLQIVRPVIEKIASIAAENLEKFDSLERICLVGGTCELEGFVEIINRNIGLPAYRPQYPQYITPFGIALSCLQAPGGDARLQEQAV